MVSKGEEAWGADKKVKELNCVVMNTDDEVSCCIPEMYVNKKVINIFIGRRYACMIIIYIYIRP